MQINGEKWAAWIRGFSWSGEQGEKPAEASIPTNQRPIFRAESLLCGAS
jgi:hypothetical protein